MQVSIRSRGIVGLLVLLAAAATAEAAKVAESVGLSGGAVDRYASAVVSRGGRPELRRVAIHTDNDAAFRAKLDVVHTATVLKDPEQRHLRLAYYIFGDDESASKLQTELIRAAHAGVKVDLLVDLWTNYAGLDRFAMLEREANTDNPSGGRLTVRFYGRPSRNILLDAAWLSSGCGASLKTGIEGGQVGATECARAKAPEIDAFVAQAEANPDGLRRRAMNVATWDTGGSGLFLSGLYAKDGDVVATSILGGEALSLKPEGASSDPESAAAQKAALVKFAKLVRDAKLSGDPFVRLAGMAQLELAMLFYGKKVNPVYNVFTGIFPIDTKRVKAYAAGGGAERVGEDREYATEFTHHKLILAGGLHWVVDGRNVDNAYNMATNALSERLTFIDTSLETFLVSPSAEMPAAFDRLFTFEEMVIGLDELQATMPNDVVANRAVTWEICAEQAGWSVWNKKAEEIKGSIAACVDAAQEEEETHAFPRAERLDRWKAHMLAKSAAYDAYVASPVQAGGEPFFPTFEMSGAERAKATLAFVENLPYSRDVYHRLYGADVTGKKPASAGDRGKNIHELLLRGMEQACLDRAAAPDDAPISEVILFNAYFSPPSVLLRAMSNMVDGTWDCGGVRLTVLTNSPETTDLRGVNLLGNEQMAAFDVVRRAHEGSPRAATVRLLSLDKARLDALLVPAEKRDGLSAEPTTVSLHSKVAVLGPERMMIGSANADFRSYMMDTNDAMYVANAPELVGRFTTWLETRLIADPATRLVREAPDTYEDPAVTRLDNLNALFLDVQKYGVAKRLDPAVPVTVVRAGEGYQVVNCAPGRMSCEEMVTDVIPAALLYLDKVLGCAVDTVGPASEMDHEPSTCRDKARRSRSDKARRLSQQELDDFYMTI